MRQKDKAIIVIGTARENNELEMVHALGYKAILFNTEIDIESALQIDVPVEIDLNNEDLAISKALSLSDKFEIQGVFT